MASTDKFSFSVYDDDEGLASENECGLRVNARASEYVFQCVLPVYAREHDDRRRDGEDVRGTFFRAYVRVYDVRTLKL